MALDTLVAKANTGSGTDGLAGQNTAAGFAGAVVGINAAGNDTERLASEATLGAVNAKLPAQIGGRVPVNIATTGPWLPVGGNSLQFDDLAASTAEIDGKLPTQGQKAMSGSLPVVLASDQSAISTIEPALFITGAAAQTAVGNNILLATAGTGALDVSNFRSASIQIVSTGTAGQFVFEHSNDEQNWRTAIAFNAELVTGVPITGAVTATASQLIYTVPIRCRFLRVRIISAITGGSLRAFSRLSTEPWTPTVNSIASPTAANTQVTVAALPAGTGRIGGTATPGSWFDDTSTALAANATFTGVSRDLTGTTAGGFALGTSAARDFRVSAESDVSGTLWIDVSRDNTNWRRAKSVATAAVTGGAHYAEIVHFPSTRYLRVGYTNGATAQARLFVNSFAMA